MALPKQETTSISPELQSLLNAANNEKKENLPTICIVIGMAGSGKTTLMQRINAHIHQHKMPSYIINLDPAVYEVPYEPNVDIRDTINYKNVMKEYKLGPNGGILTSLNLFSTKFDQVIDLIEKRKNEIDYVFIDTPGQIEVFTWSASGQIITETLSSIFPTVLIYVIDTPRCIDPITFMSNMTYACSILYKTKLPFLIVFNKIDVQSHLFAINWMESVDDFEESMNSNKSYMSTLTKSLSNVLDVFYKNIKTVGVSAVTGQGMNAFFKQIELCKKEYDEQFKPMLIRKKNEIKKKEEEEKKKQMEKIENDMKNNKKLKKQKMDEIQELYKNATHKQNLEKLMNLGINDEEEDEDGDQEMNNDEEQDEILNFLQN